MLQTNETVLQNFDLGSCLYLCGSIKLLQFMARYMARVAPLITITILCGCGISCYINCDLLFQVLIFAIRMWLLRCLISTYDQIPVIIFYIISMECGRLSYLCNVPQWQWVTRNVCFHRLGNWTVKMSLLFYFTFVCYEFSQGLIMPLEAREIPGPPALTDTPAVGFSP